MYLSTPYSRVVALEPETGKKLWEYTSEHTPANRGIAYFPGGAGLPPQILFGTNDGWLIAPTAHRWAPQPDDTPARNAPPPPPAEPEEPGWSLFDGEGAQ